MKNTATISSSLLCGSARLRTARAPSRGSCARRMIFDLLGKMRRGSLVLELPDGTRITFGSSPTAPSPALPGGIAARACILVRDERFFRRCILAGDIGFGESYVDGDWDTPDLVAVIAWFLLNLEDTPTLSGSARRTAQGWIVNLLRFANRAGHLLRPNSRRAVRRNIAEHYDLSNAFFRELLDPSMMYSSAIWRSADQSLAEAQEEKNESLCRLLRLGPRDRVLEIGTGWGGWAIHAARRYGCRITSITISEQQFTLAWDRVKDAGVSDRVDVQLLDYRDIRGRYDKVVSIEMMEALGHRYLPEFCRTVARALVPGGLLALQFITCPDSRYEQFRRGVDFIQKHIFPGSLLLSLNRVNEHLSRAGGFVLNHLSDHGHDYARTLREWHRRLGERRDTIARLGLDDAFIRKWSYYLNYCEAAFAMRNISVVQTLHTRPNNLALRALPAPATP